METGADFSHKSSRWIVGKDRFSSVFPLGSSVAVEGIGVGRIASDIWYALFPHECYVRIDIEGKMDSFPVRLISKQNSLEEKRIDELPKRLDYPTSIKVLC
jgi:hypothetical protein